MPALLVLALLVALTGARPQSYRDVKLITKPLPGQEYVMIQRSEFTRKSDGEFMTAHSIPRALPEDHPEDLIVKTSKSKIKRESDSLDEVVPALASKVAEAEAEVAEHPSKGGKVEVRTEFSVATSKQRKGGKEAKERAIAFSPKETSSAPVPSPTLEVNVETKGNTGKLEGTLSGADEKKVMIKKLSAADHATKVASKEELTLKEVEVQPSSELGVNSPQVAREEGAITVPLQKKQAVSAPQEVSTATPLPNHTSKSPSQDFDILPVNILPKTAEKVNDKDKDFDFVDTPLADKVLVPAGSNQQSRIEVKKGPNGQDYEYEYVYYYYDDDENDAAGGTGAKKTAVVKGSTTSTTTAAPTTSSRQYLPKKEAEAAHHDTTRARTRGQSAAVVPEAKTRYTSIERATTAASETSNEIIPARGAAASRTRGRTLTTEEPTVAEERLPVNTRFPPRSRSNHNSNSVASTTPLPQDTPTTRVRGSSGTNSVRRPSLELVDSSSFKTQSSDASRDQDPRPEFPKTLPAANEEEEVVKPRGRGRGQTSTTPAPAIDEEDEDIPSESHSRGQLSRRPDAAIRSRGQVTEDEEDEDISSLPASVTEVPDDGLSLTTVTDVDMGLTAAAMDKAALELYAVLSQARAESNSIDEDASDDELTTELEDVSTTLEPTTEPPTTTTTTTTTPAPTTTTTTSETPLAAGKGRYRQRGNVGTSAPRNRFRAGSSDAGSTSTTETPTETSTKARARFGSNRVTSAGGRRGFSKPTSPRPEEEAASESEAPKTDAAPPTHHRPAGLPRNRFGSARIPKVTTPTSPASSSADETHAATPSSAAPAKPVFADRFNLRRRGGGIKLHSTPAPVSEETKAESSGEETNESAAEPSTTAASVRVPARNRLSVGSGPRPLRPGPRVNIASRGRLGAATTTTVAPSTESEDAGSEQTSSASQEETQPEEAPEAVTTQAPDALTRLRNRPRLRVSAVKPTSAPTAAPIRRPLIARRKLGHPAEVKESVDTEAQDSSSVADDAPPSSEESSETSGDEVSSPATAEPEQPQGLASLVSGRRRGNALRRPRTLLPGGKTQNPAS